MCYIEAYLYSNLDSDIKLYLSAFTTQKAQNALHIILRHNIMEADILLVT